MRAAFELGVHMHDTIKQRWRARLSHDKRRVNSFKQAERFADYLAKRPAKKKLEGALAFLAMEEPIPSSKRMNEARNLVRRSRAARSARQPKK